jgi:hypothetical protein
VFFRASYWSAKFGTFVQTPNFSSYWLEDFADGTPKTGEKIINTAPLALSKALAGSQSAFFIMVNDNPLVISTEAVNSISHRH